MPKIIFKLPNMSLKSHFYAKNKQKNKYNKSSYY